MRDPNTIEIVQSVTPDWLISVFSVLTRFGGVSVLLAIACLYYWVGDRERSGYTFAVILGGLALLAGLKATFAYPRPPAELHLIATDSPSFPSGHAMGATVVYGILALSMDRFSNRGLRLAVAGVIVAIVSVPRIALGVHYPIDIGAGIVAGAGYLVLVTYTSRGDAYRAFLIAVAIALGGLVVGSIVGTTPNSTCLDGLCFDRDVLVATAAAGGGFMTWSRIDDRVNLDRWIYAIGVAGLAIFVVGITTLDVSTGILVAAAAIGIPAVLLLPKVIDRSQR
ncbi:MAG: phosphatase PAP2 family protein [Natronomonas sp.]